MVTWLEPQIEQGALHTDVITTFILCTCSVIGYGSCDSLIGNSEKNCHATIENNKQVFLQLALLVTIKWQVSMCQPPSAV